MIEQFHWIGAQCFGSGSLGGRLVEFSLPEGANSQIGDRVILSAAASALHFSIRKPAGGYLTLPFPFQSEERFDLSETERWKKRAPPSKGEGSFLTWTGCGAQAFKW